MKSDKELIADIYRRVAEHEKGQRVNSKRQKIQTGEFLRQFDRLILLFASSATTILEKKRAANKWRTVYRSYAAFCQGNPDGVNASLKRKAEMALDKVVSFETELVSQYRAMETGGERLDLEAIFADGSQDKMFMSSNIESVLEELLERENFTVVSKVDVSYYITGSGMKYHRRDCPYCRGRKLEEASFAKITNAGYQPCKCIDMDTDKDSGRISDQSSPEGAGIGTDNEKKETVKTVTAFIDESVRYDPWGKWDPEQRAPQASYSYLICRGALIGEEEITDDNLMDSNCCLANGARDTSYAAMEAIGTVLMKLAFSYDFHGDVVIYTDNKGAMTYWYTKRSNMYLANQFHSVKVGFIPREKNTKADALGRTKHFNVTSERLYQLVNEQYEEGKAAMEKLAFVKKFFPVPEKNIPNLMQELRLMAEQKGGEQA